MLSITRLVHAGILVETKQVSCIMDPCLLPRMSERCVPEPYVLLNRAKLRRKRFDLLVISHVHGDHFCLDSLDLIDRGAQVIFPKGSWLVEACLSRMGFRNFREVSPWEKIRFRDLELTATPSKGEFDEMGILFESGGRTCWNCVDTLLDAKIIRRVRALGGRPDVMFGYYQLLAKNTLYVNALGCDFPYREYETLLKHAGLADPGTFVPSSCGVKEEPEVDWLNDRQWMMSEAKFLEDLGRTAPRIRGLRLAPGDRIEIGARSAAPRLRRNSLDFLRGRVPGAYAKHDWRPDRGVPPIHDPNLMGWSAEKIKRSVRRYLDGEFLRAVRDPVPVLELLREKKVLWRLEIVYPDGSKEQRWMDFGAIRSRASWKKPGPEAFAHITTSVASSMIPGLLTGEVSVFSAVRYFRIAARTYTTGPGGVIPFDVGSEEPLSAVLFPGAQERYLIGRVMKLGYST